MAKPSPEIRREEREAAYAIACRHRPELAGDLTLEEFMKQVDAVVRRRGGRPRGWRRYPDEDAGVLYMVALCQLAGDTRKVRDILREILGHGRATPTNRLDEQYRRSSDEILATARSSGLVISEGQDGALNAKPASPQDLTDLKFITDSKEWEKAVAPDKLVWGQLDLEEWDRAVASLKEVWEQLDPEERDRAVASLKEVGERVRKKPMDR
jgi:hypothetical protein